MKIRYFLRLIIILFISCTSEDRVRTISIDVDQTGEPINEMIYGQFIEHLGRCIYGGIWAEMVEDRKFYYKEGFQLFLKKFIKESPDTLYEKIKQKMRIYIVDDESSDITFFVGKRMGERSKVGLVLLNNRPFGYKGTPEWAFETRNEMIIEDMMNMFHEVTGSQDAFTIDYFLDQDRVPIE